MAYVRALDAPSTPDLGKTQVQIPPASPSPSRMAYVPAIDTLSAPDLGKTQVQIPTASPSPSRKRRMMMKEMTEWWNRVLSEGDENDSEFENCNSHDTTKEDSETEMQNPSQEAVWVERKGDCLLPMMHEHGHGDTDTTRHGYADTDFFLNFPREECRTRCRTRVSDTIRHGKMIFLGVSVHHSLLLNFRCPCGEGYQVLLFENSCYYKLISVPVATQSPSPFKKLGTARTSSLSPSCGDSPSIMRLMRMKQKVKEMSEQWNQVPRDEENTGFESNKSNNITKEESRTILASTSTLNPKEESQEEMENPSQEAVWVETNEEGLVLSFECPCGNGYQTLLYGNSFYYKLKSYPEAC